MERGADGGELCQKLTLLHEEMFPFAPQLGQGQRKREREGERARTMALTRFS